MKWVSGWQCETCKRVDKESPWPCVGCGQEVCEYCFHMLGHCRACCQGKSEVELAAAANATGNFEFQV